MKKILVIGLTLCLILNFTACVFDGCKTESVLFKKDKVERAIVAFLADKYQSSFIVQEVYQEFDGTSGRYFRALCRSDVHEDTFTVYCYESDERGGDSLCIDGKTYFVEDMYAEVLLQNHLLKLLGDYKEDSMFVRCKVNFVSEQPDAQKVIEDPVSCIAQAKAYLRIYIIVGDEDPAEMQARAEALMKKYNPYTGYLYVATKMPFDLKRIEEVYASNQHDFGNYLTNENWADRVDFSLYRANE